MLSGGNESGDVGHVHHEPGAYIVSYLTEAGEVYGASVGGGAGDHELGTTFLCQSLDLIVVYGFKLPVHAV